MAGEDGFTITLTGRGPVDTVRAEAGEFIAEAAVRGVEFTEATLRHGMAMNPQVERIEPRPHPKRERREKQTDVITDPVAVAAIGELDTLTAFIATNYLDETMPGETAVQAAIRLLTFESVPAPATGPEAFVSAVLGGPDGERGPDEVPAGEPATEPEGGVDEWLVEEMRAEQEGGAAVDLEPAAGDETPVEEPLEPAPAKKKGRKPASAGGAS